MWDARDHHVHLPWRTMRSVLEAVRQVGSSLARYRQLVASGRHVFVSQPAPAYLRSIGPSSVGAPGLGRVRTK